MRYNYTAMGSEHALLQSYNSLPTFSTSLQITNNMGCYSIYNRVTSINLSLNGMPNQCNTVYHEYLP
jgi:hypothetical protein